MVRLEYESLEDVDEEDVPFEERIEKMVQAVVQEMQDEDGYLDQQPAC
ncbi:hypothetical protein ISS86_02695 [Candidatus Microgenomates bacterium]|nr:hypothetical protein [Candidatus Microgenomates bacterium]